MDTSHKPFPIESGAGIATASRNPVLRNTYMLLGLSMVPTVIGAAVGVQLKFNFLSGSPLMAFLLFLGVAWGFMWGIERNKNSGIGVALLLGFTFLMGLMLSRILQVALGFANGGTLIALAAGGTAGVFVAMSALAATIKRDLGSLGKFLFVGTIVLLLAIVANIFFQIPALALTISAVTVLLFSAWLMHDIARIVQGGEDNYVVATLAVYLDIYNIFAGLLNLLMMLTGQRD